MPPSPGRILQGSAPSPLFSPPQSRTLLAHPLPPPFAWDFHHHSQKALLLQPSKAPSAYQLATLKSNLPDLLSLPPLSSESSLLHSLLQRLHSWRPGLFERLSNVLLTWTAKSTLLRIHLLKFLAILPSLEGDSRGDEMKSLFLEALRRSREDSLKAKRLQAKERPLPGWLLLSFRLLSLLTWMLPAPLLSLTLRWSVQKMARRFIAGESLEQAEKSIRTLLASGRDLSLDPLGELVVSEEEADRYTEKVICFIQGMQNLVPKGEKNAAGLYRANISLKVSALCGDFRPYAEKAAFERISPRLRRILLEAKEREVFVTIDAEQESFRDITFKIYARTLLETPALTNFKQTGVVLQAYLRDAHAHFQEILKLAKARGGPLPIRLVKGAYWDQETIEARAHSSKAALFLNKEETDLHFRQLVICILENFPQVQLCLASHNPFDHCFAEALRRERFPEVSPLEHQCLHMTYEALSTGLSQMNWPTRNYIPIGDLLVGMAYLVRRIMENSSQVGVLTQARVSKENLEKSPSPATLHQTHLEKGTLVRDPVDTSFPQAFSPLPPLRPYKEKEWELAFRTLQSFQEKSLGTQAPNPFG